MKIKFKIKCLVDKSFCKRCILKNTQFAVQYLPLLLENTNKNCLSVLCLLR